MIFWNEEFTEDSQGLDIIGVRAIDQKLEANLVNGITTISARGRYFSILPWAINQFYQSLLAENAPFDPKALGSFLHRAEFLVIAASLHDPAGKPGGAILGSEVYREEMAKLRSGAPIPFPSSTGSRMLGTYYSPCKAIGLLRDSPSGSPLPYQLTERGKKIWAARDDELQGSAVVAVLLDGDVLTPDIAREAVSHFSLRSLVPTSAEATLLAEAFQTPWPAPGNHEAIVQERYVQFSGTLSWIEARISEGKASANAILSRNFRAVSEGQRQDKCSLDWAGYEWRRRQHFAQELLLASVCGILRLGGDLSVPEIIATIKELSKTASDLDELWPEARSAWTKTAREAVSSVPKVLMLGSPLPFAAFNQLKPAHQMLGAYGIIAALEKQTRAFRQIDFEKAELSASDLAVKLIHQADDQPFEMLLRQLLETCAILPHLHVTLRKMANHQKCSLRFFPDGDKLRLTANQSGAGFSGSRLDNTLTILVDINLLVRRDDGSLVRSEAA